MQFCYVDEAGCTGVLPSASSDIQPVLVVAGVVVPQETLAELTREFIHLKREFFPANRPRGSSHLDWIVVEVKGSELRRQVAGSSRNRRRHAIGFLDKTVGLLERHKCRLKGRVWVKGIAAPFNGRSVYTSSIQYIHDWFNAWLEFRNDRGVVICDSRNKALNTIVSHSIFTQKFRAVGDKHPLILEMPTFGHSENHAGLQLADLVCSGLLFPMAIDAYCRGRLTGTHIRRGYDVLRKRFGLRLEGLQYRIADADQAKKRLVGGIMVDDQIGYRPRASLFAVTAMPAPALEVTLSTVPAPPPPTATTP